ncbi:MAG: hypothetical protein QM783_03300 [Phycisphaerales bacterium]
MDIRKRMKRRDEPNSIRFVTASCNHRLNLFGSDGLRDIFVESLAAARARYRFELFAWVLMPNHFHLLVRPRRVPLGRPVKPLAPVLASIKQGVSQRVIPRWKELDAPILPRLLDSDGSVRFWQPGGGFDRTVRDLTEFTKEVQYIHRNPVKRGLVSKPEDWRWSSVHWWMGARDGVVVCDLPPGKLDWASWKGFM